MSHTSETSIPPVVVGLIVRQGRSSCKSVRAIEVFRFGRFRHLLGPSLSFSAHLLLVLILALLGVRQSPSPVRPNLITAATVESNQTLVEFELTPMKSDEVAPRELKRTEAIKPTDVKLPELSIALPEVKIESDMPAASLDWRLFAIDNASSKRIEKSLNAKLKSTSFRTLASNGAASRGNSDGAAQGQALGGEKQAGASYFGTRAAGDKFIFIVDKSRSMEGLRWQVAVQELIRSLHDLRTDTKFYLFCFDSREYPFLDGSRSNVDFVTCNSQTLKLVQQWISSLRPDGSTRPAMALTMALAMQPSAIFLLSDGELKDNSLEMLRTLNRDLETRKTKVPIHTILLMSQNGRSQLKAIAAENASVFRDVTEQEWLAAQRIAP